MNLLFNLPASVPYQMAGAETMAHRMAKFLVSKGHQVTILQPAPDVDMDGVKIRKWERAARWKAENVAEFQAADLVFTHLGQTADSFNKARLHRRKLVHIAHNDHKDALLSCRIDGNYVIYNSDWVRESLAYAHDGFTLCPPVDYRDFAKVKTSSAKYVGLINLNENKGGQVFIDIARRMPKVSFLGVEGGYYPQIKDESLANVKYTPCVTDIRKVLKDIKILLVPSDYESWGQVAIEAAACGIPVIATPTPGLQSALNGAGIYVERTDLAGWERAINTLLTDPKAYASACENARNRAKELDPLPGLEAMENWLQGIHKHRYTE